MFGHALTHEVAYQSLMKRRRKELHEKVGSGSIISHAVNVDPKFITISLSLEVALRSTGFLAIGQRAISLVVKLLYNAGLLLGSSLLTCVPRRNQTNLI